MKAVYKYTLEKHGKCTLELPLGCEVLKLDARDNKIAMWCLIDTEMETSLYDFYVAVTGENIEDCRIQSYIGTADVGGIVYHVFTWHESWNRF